MTGPAIGQVLVGGAPRGTAFAVTDDLLLTCWHCVNDPARPDDGTRERIEVAFAPGVRTRVVFLQADVEHDVALLGFAPPFRLPAGWSPVRLGRDADAPRGTAADLSGWPLDRPASVVGRTLPCRVEQEAAIGPLGTVTLQLFADQIVGGIRPRGFSGSPVLARTPAGAVAVGIARWMEEDRDDAEKAVGGVVYAARVSDVTAFWPSLRPVPQPALELAGDLQAPSRLAVEDFITAQLRGPGGELPFAGRDDALNALTGWLDDPEGAAYHLVSGPAGIGKSTLLVRWAAGVAARPGLHVVLVPISIRYETSTAREALLALVHRLSSVHGETYDRTVSAADAKELVRALLARPAPPGRTIVVVVDALDEAEGWTPGARLFPARPGAGVRVLLSARHTAEHPTGTAWSDGLRLPDAVVTEVPRLGPDTMGDLLRQLRPDAPDLELAAAADRLWALTRGEPVTVALHLQALVEEPGRTPAEWTAGTVGAPPGLSGFFDVWWKEQRQLWAREGSGRLDDAERVLRILVSAHGPVTRADVRTLVGRLHERLDSVRLDGALEILGRFVLPGRTAGTVVVAHQVITDMMRARLDRDGSAGEYRKAFVAWGLEVLAALLERRIAPGEVPNYLARHLAGHLIEEPGLHPSAMVLAGPAWRTVKDLISDDIDAFRADVELVAARARALDEERWARGKPPRLLPERVICASEVAGERRALGSGVSSEMAAEFVRHGLWRPGRALSYIAAHTHPGLSDRAYGVAAMAPLVPAADMPALDQLVDSALESVYSEEKAAVVSAWALRLYELGHVSEAMRAAVRLPAEHEARTFVAVWVLADLIGRMPDDLAGAALAMALDELENSSRRHQAAYAVCHLTKVLPLERAERIWPPGHETTGGHWQWPFSDPAPPAAHLVSLMERFSRVAGGGVPFLAPGAGPNAYWVDHEAFVAVARWLAEEWCEATLWILMRQASDDPSNRPYGFEEAFLPGINYDGLLSVLPAGSAPDAVEWVGRHFTGSKRLCGLAQLLPLLDEDARLSVVAGITGAEPEDLNRLSRDINLLYAAVPAMVEAGCTDELVDIIGRTDDNGGWLTVDAAPSLDRAQVDAALAAMTSGDFSRQRKALLARRASFSLEGASAVLDEVHSGPADALSGELTWLLNAYLAGERSEEPPREETLTSWWTSAYWGSPPPGGAHFYPPRPRRSADDDRDTVLDIAIDLVGGVAADDVPVLIERARTTSEPWLGLCLLAAGTHLPPGDALDAVVQEIAATLARVRAATDGRSAYPFPDGSPWLVTNVNGWTPFFARLIAPAVRPAVAALLFDGGYADGVELPNTKGRGDLDTWAIEALSLTPLFTASQLAEFERCAHRLQGARSIDSGTVRGYVFAGIAAGHAHHGDVPSAYRVMDSIGGPRPLELRRDVLCELLYLLNSADVPEWIAVAHRMTRSAEDRGRLWGHLATRLEELTDDQMWTVLNRWLTRHATGSRGDVIADVLLYRTVIRRLAGQSECGRLRALIDERERA